MPVSLQELKDTIKRESQAIVSKVVYAMKKRRAKQVQVEGKAFEGECIGSTNRINMKNYEIAFYCIVKPRKYPCEIKRKNNKLKTNSQLKNIVNSQIPVYRFPHLFHDYFLTDMVG